MTIWNLASLTDPISLEVFTDPVVASDGFTYNRSSIGSWINECRACLRPVTSPLTGKTMGAKLRENIIVRQIIEELDSKSPSETASETASSSFDSCLQEGENVPSISDLARLFQVADPVKHVLGDVSWQVPQIVFLGNEDSGKTTLLQRIARLPLCLNGSHNPTRMVIKICLRYGEAVAPWLKLYEVDSGEVVRDAEVAEVDALAEQIYEWMYEEVQRENGGAISGVCRNRMIALYIQSPNVPNLDLVDLPGFVAARGKGEPCDVSSQTHQLVEHYLDQCAEDSIFVVAVPANTRVNQSIAMDIIQQRNLQERTIGVLTKVDLLLYRDADDSPSDFTPRLNQLQNKLDQQSSDIVPLHQHGYVATMNKQPRHQPGGWHDEHVCQALREQRWFLSKGVDDDDYRDSVAVPALVTRLNNMYFECWKKTWLPTVKGLIQSEIGLLENENTELGLPAAHDFTTMRQADFTTELQAVFAAVCSEPALTSLRQQMQNSDIPCHNAFAPAAARQRLSAMQEFLKQQLAVLCDRQIEAIVPMAAHCAQLCCSYVQAALAKDQSDFRISRFDGVLRSVDVILKQTLDDWQNDVRLPICQLIRTFHETIIKSGDLKLEHSFHNGTSMLSCEADFSNLCAALYDAMSSSIFERLSKVQWRGEVPWERGLWQESCALQRTSVLSQLDAATTTQRCLERMSVLGDFAELCSFTTWEGVDVQKHDDEMSVLDGLDEDFVGHARVGKRLERTNMSESMPASALFEHQWEFAEHAALAFQLGVLQGAISQRDVFQLTMSASWLAEYLSGLPTVERSDLIREHDGVSAVHHALEFAIAVGEGADEALISLLGCVRRLSTLEGAGDVRTHAEHNLECFRSLETVRHIIALLDDSPATLPEVLAAACECLLHLTRDYAINELTGNAGGCETVIRMLRCHIADARIARWACGVIYNLSAVNNDDSGARLAEAGACELVTRALEQHRTDADIANWARRVITQLMFLAPTTELD